MEWYEKADNKEIEKVIIDCVMRDSGCSRENAEIFYKIAYDIDIDLWEFYEEDLKEYFAEDEEDDYSVESDTEYYASKGIKSGNIFDNSRFKPFR